MTLHKCVRDLIVPGIAAAGHHDRFRHNAATACEDGAPDDGDALGGYDG